jgi:hypothetical protein
MIQNNLKNKIKFVNTNTNLTQAGQIFISFRKNFLFQPITLITDKHEIMLL